MNKQRKAANQSRSDDLKVKSVISDVEENKLKDKILGL